MEVIILNYHVVIYVLLVGMEWGRTLLHSSVCPGFLYPHYRCLSTTPLVLTHLFKGHLLDEASL